MTKIALYDFKNSKSDKIDVVDGLFDVEVKPEILHLVVNAYLAAGRSGSANTKTRSRVAGGGKKPYKQKGTGRARAGTSSSPLWRGGGVIFGPEPRKYDKKINKKVRKLALKMALSSKKDQTIVLKDFSVESGKTKDAVKLFKEADINKSLIVLGEQNEMVLRATSNIPNIKVIGRNKLNVYDLLKYDQVCIDKEVLSVLEKELV